MYKCISNQFLWIEMSVYLEFRDESILNVYRPTFYLWLLRAAALRYVKWEDDPSLTPSS